MSASSLTSSAQIIAAIAALGAVFNVHTFGYIQLLLTYIIALAIERATSREKEQLIPEYWRVFGLTVIFISTIGAWISIPTFAFDGTTHTLIGALIGTVLAGIVISMIHQATIYIIAKTYDGRNNARKQELTGRYVFSIVLFGFVATYITAAGLVTIIAIYSKSWKNILKLVLLSIVLLEMFLAYLAHNTYITRIATAWKNQQKRRALILSALGILTVYALTQINTEGISAIIAQVLSIIGLTAILFISKDIFDKKSVIMMVLATALLLAPIWQISILKNDGPNCTENFEIHGKTIFAYGPQELIVETNTGDTFVIKPWEETKLDINTFCSAKYRIITSLGKYGCNPTEQICGKK